MEHSASNRSGRRADAPLADSSGDRLHRLPLAKQLALDISEPPEDGGLVVALCGPWGSGKTSVANMALSQLKDDVVVVRFNPWVFSDAEDLVDRFFAEIAQAVGQHDAGRKVVGAITNYAGSLASVAGTVSSVAKLVPGGATVGAWADLVKSAAETGNEEVSPEPIDTRTLDEQRSAIVTSLREFGQPIVVLIDDVDRLTDEEVFAVVRLVKLVGDLSGVVYLMLFDRERVEEVLGASGADPEQRRARGRAYLEKIVQSRYDLPEPRPHELADLLFEQIPRLVLLKPLDQLVLTAVGRLVKTPRDVTRVVNALSSSIRLHATDVASVDLLGMEVLRILEPDLHAALPSFQELLFAGTRYSSNQSEEALAREGETVTQLVSRAVAKSDCEGVLAALFPAKAEGIRGPTREVQDRRIEQRDKRVASPAVFRRYYHGSVDPGALSGTEVEALREALSENGRVEDFFKQLADDQLVGAVELVPLLVRAVSPESAADHASALEQVAARLPDEYTRILGGLHWRSESLRVAIRSVLEQSGGAETQERAALLVYARANGLSERLRLLKWLGTPAGRDTETQDEPLGRALTERLSNDLRSDVVVAEPESLANEPELRLLLEEVLVTGDRASTASTLEYPEALLRVLVDSGGWRTGSQGGGPNVSWWVMNYDSVDRLVGKELLGEQLASLEDLADVRALTELESDALRQARRYVDGKPAEEWGPDDS